MIKLSNCMWCCLAPLPPMMSRSVLGAFFFLQQVNVLCKEKQWEEGNGFALCEKYVDTR